MGAMGDVASWGAFFLGGWGTVFSAYVLIQALALCTLRAAHLRAALFPLGVMLVVGLLTVVAYRGQSNLWPILLVLTSPIALLAVAIIEVVGLRARAHPHREMLTAITVGIAVPTFLLIARVLYKAH
jgi:hypothetical protein